MPLSRLLRRSENRVKKETAFCSEQNAVFLLYVVFAAAAVTRDC